MLEILREFFGFGGYKRTPEGAYSWQHLTFVGISIALMIALAIILGIKNKNKSEQEKNKVLIWAAILIDGFEILKIIIFSIQDPTAWTRCLPLFLCSIQLITIPLAALSKGRIREAALDFILIFGILGGIAGTIGAAQNYANYPVLSFTNVVSAITHCISGFASLYIGISRMASMKKENIWILSLILATFIVLAFIANAALDYNYMFLRRDDGTPYTIVTAITGTNEILYPMGVILLFVIYIALFYGVWYLVKYLRNEKRMVSA